MTAAMCERPAILRGLRRVDALAMAACALALAVSPPAGHPPANAATGARANAATGAPATAPAGTLTARR